MKHRTVLFALLASIAIAPSTFAQAQIPNGPCGNVLCPPEIPQSGSTAEPAQPDGGAAQAACTYRGCPEYYGYYCPSNDSCYERKSDIPQRCRSEARTCY